MRSTDSTHTHPPPYSPSKGGCPDGKARYHTEGELPGVVDADVIGDEAPRGVVVGRDGPHRTVAPK